MRHKYSLIQKTETISIDVLVDIGYGVLVWCKENMGVNRRHKKNLKILLTNNESNVMGLYFPYENQIDIYLGNNKYIRDFVQTIIHEYTHVLQPIKTKYNKSIPRDENPYEIEADENELKYYHACWKEVKKKYRL